MWIVRLALRRPYTFVVAAILIFILGIVTILGMPTDIFPNVNIPVISVIYQYSGMTPDDMENRVVYPFEKILTTTVNDIEHSESQCLVGISVTRIYFQPNANIQTAIAQVTAIAQTAIRQMPPGTQPPLIIQYSASNVPILQLSFGSDTIPEQKLFDIAVNKVRLKLVTVPGVQIPYPYGGKMRQIMVDLQPDKLFAWGISPTDVSNAIGEQNIILPAGTAKIGNQEYPVELNGSPTAAADLNNLPIKTVNGIPIYVRDVANVRDGFSVQTSFVHADGKRGVLLSILKNGGASTLDVVSGVMARMQDMKGELDEGLTITPVVDQSLYVRASVNGVEREAIIAAALTGLMILIFLGSWRSTLIVVTSIPLSILVSIIVMDWLGQTLNVMTLGGMALAVGILVDDATVEIENIHRNLGQKKRLVQAILDGASQIAVPAFVSTLCICIVFVPVVFISGPARSLFVPLAMAVVFAMLTSYLLSRTLVPTMIHYLLASEVEMYGGKLDPHDPHAHIEQAEAARKKPPNLLWRFHEKFNKQFERLRNVYGGLLSWSLEHRLAVLIAFVFLVGTSLLLFPLIGEDFFPTVDAGQMRLHVRAQPGTRLEQSERVFAAVEDLIRKDIPASDLGTMVDNIGIPNSGINLSLSDGSLMSSADGEILISLKEGHAPTQDYQIKLDHDFAKQFPELTFFFAPADIVTQVLNFGIAAPIDIEVTGPAGRDKNLQIARDIMGKVHAIPGAADIRLEQVPDVPDIRVAVDRTLASEVGVSQRDVAGDMLISLSGTLQANPNFWLDHKTNSEYNVLVQTPQYEISTMEELRNQPIIPTGGDTLANAQLLGNLSEMVRGSTPANITHDNIKPTFDVLAGVRGRDLGGVSTEVRKIVADELKSAPTNTHIIVRGQVQSMSSSFTGLSFGLIFAIVLVYLLMVINFQSWMDPLIILMALPGALAGILWMLFITGTTVNVPSLMGAIMSIGVATANSILMITFANDQRIEGMNAHDAALSAGMTRLRPVIMTALAMIIGMLPMSLGMGEGGEQNAPLGRAVIGGLLMATFATLFFVPIVYSQLRQKAPVLEVEEELR
jgi:multidrug efflux pump subunit AcrB